MQKLKTVTLVLAGLLVVFLVSTSSGQEKSGEIPQRADIDEKYTWDLSDMFESNEAWEKQFTAFDSKLSTLSEYKGKLGDSPENLLSCLQLRDSLNRINDNLYVYSHMRNDQDKRESDYQEMSEKASALNSRLAATESFIVPEILSIEGDRMRSFLKGTPELDVYSFYLENLQRQKAHVLSDREEELLALAGPIISAPRNIFGMINNADIDYGTIVDEDGNEITLTKGRYYSILESHNRDMRREANRLFNQGYLKFENTLAATLAASLKSDNFIREARHYGTALEMALDDDNIPESVFHNLIDAVNANLEPLHKWAAIRKRILGVDTLFPFDMYAPLTDKERKTYSYEEATELALSGLKPMGKKYLKQFQTALDSRWIDVYETEGKRSGAYQWGTYTTTPKMLLNFNGTLDHVFTLTHEMGHAMHGHYTKKNEPYIYDGHSTFTAEVASTCNEAVLMKYLLETTTDKDEKITLLLQYIDQIIGTFYTQVMFSEFELAIHDRIESGDAISAKYLRKTYRDIYQKYWGDALHIDETNDITGMRIPHFYRRYYVYQYATSYAAAQMLSQTIIENRDGALDSYHRFLATGVSKYPVDILKDAGVDMTTPEPINRTIALFSDLIDQMEELLDEG